MTARLANIRSRAVVVAALIAAVVGCSRKVPRESQLTLAALSGKWMTSVNSDTLVVAPDGSFRWGRPYSGRFSAIRSTGQLVMSMRENGKWIGGMPITVSEELDVVRLTPSSGPPLEFRRVREMERGSAPADR